MSTAERAATAIETITPKALAKINAFCMESLQTRGGRAGSGLGSLLEALWGFYVTKELQATPGFETFELAWFPDHAYNDFACVSTAVDWIPNDRSTELLRVEAKSMYLGADESKGHFDALEKELGSADLLLVLLWSWVHVDPAKPSGRVAPQILDGFVGHAVPVARLRDALHIERGGTFVTSGRCPDRCPPGCVHVGEPLNASQKRERRGGPAASKPSGVAYAANFGGLIRMLKTNSDAARATFRSIRKKEDAAHKYISFIHRNFPTEERNQHTVSELKMLAGKLGIATGSKSTANLWAEVRSVPGYQDVLRAL